MFEMILSAGITKQNIPVITDSGPGPQTIIKYDEVNDVGYFGVTTTSQLFTTEEIEAKAKTTLIGTPINRTVTDLWAKYYFKGKVIYIACRTQRSGISWDNIYNAGFVYGEDGNGLYVVGTGVNQLTTISKTTADNRTWLFKIRLPRLYTVNPPVVSNQQSIRLSEYSLTVERTYPTNNIDVSWAKLGDPGSSMVSIESVTSDFTAAAIANGNSSAYYRSRVQKNSASTSWLPVLELVSVTD